MAYPFEREPEENESDFSIQIHDIIEEVFRLDYENDMEKSIKIMSFWINKINTFTNVNEDRGALEGASMLYSMMANRMNYLEKYNESIQYCEKAIITMEKVCDFKFSPLYLDYLARSHFECARFFVDANQYESAIMQAKKCLEIQDYLIETSPKGLNHKIEDDREIVLQFIHELS